MITVGSQVRSIKLLKEKTIGTVIAMVHKSVQIELNNAIYNNGNNVVAPGEDVNDAFERWNKIYPSFQVVCWVNFYDEVMPFSGIATDSIFIPLADLEEVY